MPSGLIALLDDVAAIAKVAAASVDDIGLGVAKAGSKAAGVVIDDAAVTPSYVTGFTPDRELPIIWKITKGSLRNKLLLLLPLALLLSAFLPWAITPLLMAGGLYLSFEGAEKLIEKLSGHGHDVADEDAPGDPVALEQQKVAGAVRTDLILSAEIMAIALAEVDDVSFVTEAAALAIVAVVITIAVYGTVGLIVKMDDIGLHFAQRQGGASQRVGRGLLWAMPRVLTFLSRLGTLAMLWVGGGILLHGSEELGLHGPAGWAHGVQHAVAQATGPLGGVLGWLSYAAMSAVVGLVLGVIIAALALVVQAVLEKPLRTDLPEIKLHDDNHIRLASFLREQHLSGVDTDDDASVALEIEQARLVLFACLATIAFEITQMLAMDKGVCIRPLYLSLIMLLIAMGGAWISLLASEELRRFRVDRRYKIYHAALAHEFTDKHNTDDFTVSGVWRSEIVKEDVKRARLRLARYAVALLAAVGISFGVLAAIGTANSVVCWGGKNIGIL